MKGLIDQQFLENTITPRQSKLALQILHIFGDYRRMAPGEQVCKRERCEACFRIHFPKVKKAIEESRPISLVLPAFPGKSPNPTKVLGHLPDYAEKVALNFLDELCSRVQKIYAPGAQIVICSDGRVFSDVVGISDEHITEYQQELSRYAYERRLSNISFFSLDNVSPLTSFDELRAALMRDFATTIDELRRDVKQGGRPGATEAQQDNHRMYCGMTRFLYEDALHPGQTKSKSWIQRSARSRAYELIRRSNAWTDFIAKQFPQAIRLSIHPQQCGSTKLGIQLLSDQPWITPWHGVAVVTPSGVMLMKKKDAEKLGGELVYDRSGRPDYFKTRDSK